MPETEMAERELQRHSKTPEARSGSQWQQHWSRWLCRTWGRRRPSRVWGQQQV